ncbi:baseplate J/gp47 family protein [Rhodopila sp.]|uniref:baseplate J/gp47 family protein n=1 Tax=Rhodopila sp. TaxID=2480087 RepID=UPI003D121D4E
MNLSLKGFRQLIEDMGAALQSSSSNLIDITVGSVIRAIFEANASVVLWLQWLVVQVLQSTRASTSSGPDLDSWMLDFSLIRLPAIPSTGIVTISRFAPNLSATIPVGTVFKTADGLLSFAITEDQSLSIWQAGTSAYVLPSGVASANLPVVCLTGGSNGNVLAGTITVIAASVPGIDQVNNAAPLTDGADAESDQAFRSRFQNYLASRSRATLLAVQNAIANIQQGLDVAIEENTAPDGSIRAGSFLVVVDDGTGYPPSGLLSTVATAVDSVRPIGTTFAVIAPTVLTVNVSLVATLTSVAVASQSVSSIQNYIAVYLSSLPIGASASVTRVAQNAYLAGSGIVNIAGILLNASPSDIVPPSLTVIKAGSIVVTTNDG